MTAIITLKRFSLVLALSSLVLILALLALQAQPAQALPEYSAQTGEPCASCHLSPSGGGPRGARGQAWVGSNKPGQVPDLAQALEVLGIRLEVDPSQYQPPAQAPAAAGPLQIVPASAHQLHERLKDHDGN